MRSFRYWIGSERICHSPCPRQPTRARCAARRETPETWSSAEIEYAISRMDVVLTTRLHGVVLAIKNEVPPIAVDPIGRGGKIMRQARDDVLEQAFDYCLPKRRGPGFKSALEWRSKASRASASRLPQRFDRSRSSGPRWRRPRGERRSLPGRIA
jgi:Polysaccharide pyruvyl transferase